MTARPSIEAETEARVVEPGQVTWHCSVEDGLPDVGITIALPDGSELWFGEITRQRWAETGAKAMGLGKDDGWWIIHYQQDSAAVVGRCPADMSWAPDAIDRLALSLRPIPGAAR